MTDLNTILMIAIPSLIIGLVAGFLIGSLFFVKAKRPQPSSKLNLDDEKLKNEVLKDQVKQLNAKIQTLERALELSNS